MDTLPLVSPDQVGLSAARLARISAWMKGWVDSGKLPGLLKRFETKTLDIWKKHGIRPTGFWTVLIGDGNNDLHYMLAWESLAEREQKWNAFQADPEWHKARDESEKDGLFIANIKTSFLRPTAFSAIR